MKEELLMQLAKAGEEVGSVLLESDSPVQVQKVSQSTGSKVMAGALPLLAAVLAFLGQLPPYPRTVVIVAGFAVGGWIFNESKRRQHALQVALVNKAASQTERTVEIEPPPAKSG